jgi:hypothetical protein
MTFRGTVQDGRIVLDTDVSLPNGTRVNVEPVGRNNGNGLPRGKKGSSSKGLLTLLDLAISDKALPTDLAQQHDHYIYGTPKRARPARSTRRVSARKGSSRPRKTRRRP